MRDDKGKLSSRHLAALVVDALCDAGIVKTGDLDRAVEVAAAEIEVRKAMGDY